MMCPKCRGATSLISGHEGERVIDKEVWCSKCKIMWKLIGVKNDGSN